MPLSSELPADWHAATISIPFANEEHAVIAKRAISVDKELNGALVERSMTVEGNILKISYKAATIRLLRLATNGMMETCNLIIRTLQTFAPAEEPTKAQTVQESVAALKV